ncbi:DUF4291 family protein [Streptomyces sp. NPDC054770]
MSRDRKSTRRVRGRPRCAVGDGGRTGAEPALRAGTFVAPFERERMTWIKPSFLWMMYRSGWARKPNQERILRIDMDRAGFERALAHVALGHFQPWCARGPGSVASGGPDRPVLGAEQMDTVRYGHRVVWRPLPQPEARPRLATEVGPVIASG